MTTLCTTPRRNALDAGRSLFAGLGRHPYIVLGTLVFLGMAPPFLLAQQTEWVYVYLKAASEMAAGHAALFFIQGLHLSAVHRLGRDSFHLPASLGGPRLWYVLNVICMVAMFVWAWQLSGGSRPAGGSLSRREHLTIGLGLLCGASFAFNALSHTQTDLVIGTLMMGGCVAFSRSRELTAGVGFGLATAMKGPMWLWFPYLVWRRRWPRLVRRCSLPSASTSCQTSSSRRRAATCIWGTGCGRWPGRFRSRNYVPGSWNTDAELNQSLAGTVGRWFATTWTWSAGQMTVFGRGSAVNTWAVKGIVGGVAAALLLATLLVQGWRRPVTVPRAPGEPSAAALEFGMVIALLLLLSPMSNKAHFNILVLPGLCLARAVLVRRDIVLAVLLGAVLLVVLFSTRLMGSWCHIGLWYGSISAAALLLLIACGYTLRVRLGGEVGGKDPRLRLVTVPVPPQLLDSADSR